MKRCAFGVCVVCFAAVGFSRAEPPPEKEEAPPAAVGRHDQQGDPLPAGAIARLGTVRWRVYATSLSFSPDGKTLASGSFDDAVHLWEVDSGKGTRRQVGGEHPLVMSVAFSPDGKILAFAGADPLIRLSEAATGKPIRTLKGHTTTVQCLAFSPDGRTLASGDDHGTMRLWEVSSGKELTVFQKTAVRSMHFTRDGKGFVTAYVGGVWLRDAASGKELKRFRPENPLNKLLVLQSVAISPDGGLVAGGGDRSNPDVFVWEMASGKQIHRFRGHEGEVNGLAFSHDGKYLVSGHGHTPLKSGAPVILWDLQTGKEMKRLADPSMMVFSVAFSPNGGLLKPSIR